MPKKPNYQFQKRQKELDRQARKAEKLQRRQARTDDGEEGVVSDATTTPTAETPQPTDG